MPGRHSPATVLSWVGSPTETTSRSSAETFIAFITLSLCTDALTKSLTAAASRTNDDASDAGAGVDVEIFSAASPVALLLGTGSAVAGSVTVNF
jgi:hypothetical protein